MDEDFLRAVGVRVGLEIHQQLDTGRKLFCNCAVADPDEHPIKFSRRLRPAKSELGQTDPAALFEGAKSRTVQYSADPGSSCLVEQDEEPPHDPDPGAIQTAIIIATALHSDIFRELFTMRKTVVDGSNTSGFQRTMLVSQGGYYEAGGTRIGIQSVCLEEDAAKILDSTDKTRRYGLERLGVPLVEIATEPFEADAGRIRQTALALGRILRTTRRVRRGLGTIRQDVNISIRQSKTVIEVKGMQQLDMMQETVTYEAQRQHGLLAISEKINKAGGLHGGNFEVTCALQDCKSKIVSDALARQEHLLAILWKNMSGLFGFSPYPDVRLGRDAAELARTFGIGGVFHSDELPGYGIQDADVQKIREVARADAADAFLLLAAPEHKIHVIADSMVSRILDIAKGNIPADTRMATKSGQTRFLRPRPGAARMYPETDILPVIITDGDIRSAHALAPKSWDDSILQMQEKYGLNRQLAEQVFDSRYLPLFERLCMSEKSSPNFVASVLFSIITNLERKGLDRSRLSDDVVCDVFSMLDAGSIPKESVEVIFSRIMSGEPALDVLKSAASTMSDAELDAALQRIVDENVSIIQNQGAHASGPLMGIAMKSLRGKASGRKISDVLEKKIEKLL